MRRNVFDAVNMVYYTGFENTLALDMQSVRLKAPTSIREIGARGVFGFSEVAKTLDVSAGYGLRHYIATPQRIDLTGFGPAQQTCRYGQCHFGEAVGRSRLFPPVALAFDSRRGSYRICRYGWIQGV